MGELRAPVDSPRTADLHCASPEMSRMPAPETLPARGVATAGVSQAFQPDGAPGASVAMGYKANTASSAGTRVCWLAGNVNVTHIAASLERLTYRRCQGCTPGLRSIAYTPGRSSPVHHPVSIRKFAPVAMILTGNEIKAQLGGNIIIDPFDESQLNPNSYNLRLHNELLVYEEIVLDMRRPNRFRRYVIPEDGLVLNPNQLYLGRTVERTETLNYVPMLEGRSSVGRLGLFVHITAGFGDVGFRGFWTLEMFAVQPVRVYPGVPICQIFYHAVKGDVSEYHSDKYQNNHDIQPSLLFKEFEQRRDPQMRLVFGQELAR